MAREIYYNFSASAPPAEPTKSSTLYVEPLVYPVGGGYYCAKAFEGNNESIVTRKSFGITPTDYIAYYPFNGNTLDESGNGYNLTNNGATLTTDRNGNANSAYSFDGVNDYMETTIPLLFTAKQITIAFSVKANMVSTERIILELSSNYNGNNAFLLSIVNNAIVFSNSSTSNTYNLCSISAISTEWNRICIVSDRSVMGVNQTKFFVNGSLVASTNAVNESVDTLYGQYILRVGGRATVACFNGILDEIKIYNRDLTEEEAILLTTE